MNSKYRRSLESVIELLLFSLILPLSAAASNGPAELRRFVQAGQAPSVNSPAQTSGPARDVITIMPFENLSGRAEYNWIGEAFAEKLATLLNRPEIIAIQPDERDVAYKQEGLPPTAVLTHATMFKIAERAGANLVVLGTYRVDGEGKAATITFAARTIDINQGRQIGREQTAGGPILELERLQGELAYEILAQHNPSTTVTRDKLVTESTSVPIGAFENLVKGKLTREHDAKIGFFEQAAKEYSEKNNGAAYPEASFQLGRIKYDDKQYSDAIEQLKGIGPKFARYDEAQFYIAASEFALGQTDKALDDLNRLKTGMPLYEVYNNIGVIYIKQKQYPKAIEHLTPASDAAPRDTDTLFNLGYAYYMSGDYKNAVEILNRELERRANDGQAQYLLGKSLAAAGQQEQAAKATDEARRQLPDYAQWETKGVPFLGRIKETFSKVNFYRYKRDQEQKLQPASLTAVDKPQIDSLLSRAQSAFQAGRDDEALNALGEVLQAAPQSWEAHLLMGRIFERRGDTDRATNELKSALFWNPRLVDAQVMLGRIALLKNDCRSAQTASEEAIKIDSSNQEAQALKKLVDQKCKSSPQP